MASHIPFRKGEEHVEDLIANPEYEKLVPPLSEEDFKSLENSILKEGVLFPVIINPQKTILDGYHRLKICKLHDIREVETVERSFDSDLEEMEFVISINLNRRHLSSWQKVELGLSLLKIEMLKAKRRQTVAGKLYGRGRGQGQGQGQGYGQEEQKKEKVALNSEEPSSGMEGERGEALEIAARKVGLGRDTLWRASKIFEAAKKDPSIAKQLEEAKNGDGSVRSLFQEVVKRSAAAKDQAPAIPSTTEGVYQIIVLAPPWKDYKKVEKLIIPSDVDCILWFWTTNQLVHDALHLLEKWDFVPKTILTWVKNKKGGGSWLLEQTEHCILATKGSPSVSLSAQSTALLASPGIHNSKPPEFFELVDSLCAGRKLDYYSKVKRDGWNSFVLMEVAEGSDF